MCPVNQSELFYTDLEKPAAHNLRIAGALPLPPAQGDRVCMCMRAE